MTQKQCHFCNTNFPKRNTKKKKEYCKYFSYAPIEKKGMFKNQLLRSWGLYAHRAWAELLEARVSELGGGGGVARGGGGGCPLVVADRNRDPGEVLQLLEFNSEYPDTY